MNLLKSFMPELDGPLKNRRAACALRTCRATQLMRSLPGSRPGVRVGTDWYCSVDCFAEAARTQLESLCSRRVVEITRHPRLSLGLILLSKNYLTSEQLRVATAQSQSFDEDIDETLVSLGMVTERQLAAARSAQWGYPMLAPGSVGQIVEADIPKTILNACRAVPLHYSSTARRIVLGFSSRVEHRCLEVIEETTRCRVEPCIVTPTDFEEQMERVATPPHYEEIVIGDPGSPEAMARTVGRIAVQVAAREATFASYRNLVLARVTGKRGVADIVFCLQCRTAAEIGEQSGIFKEAIAV
jgi:hypothetical protein